MSQNPKTPRVPAKRRASTSETSPIEPEFLDTFRRSVDINSIKERYDIRLSIGYDKQVSTSQSIHFAEEIVNPISNTEEELKAGIKK